MEKQRYSITSQELNDEILRRKYRELLTRPEVFPSIENWQYIIDRHMQGLGQGLYRKYLVSWLLNEEQRCEYHITALQMFPEYLKAVDHTYAVETVYSDVDTSPQAASKLIYECELFDSYQICELLDSQKIDLAISLLDARQPVYDADTVDGMQYLLKKIYALPNIGTYETKKVFFKNEQQYICPNGHSNPSDTIYCLHEGCGKDIKGLTEKQHSAINEFSERIEILSDLLN